MTSKYTTTLNVFEYFKWNLKIPAFVSGETPVKEIVDSSGTLATASIIYLDHNKVIDKTLSLSYGTAATIGTGTALVLGTDYTVEIDDAKIIMLGSGVGKVGELKVFAEYQYSDMVEDSLVSDIIERATQYLKSECDQTFGTSYVIEKEEYIGKGKWNRLYRCKELPINFIQSQLLADIATATTTVLVSDNSKFTSGDVCTIGTEVVKVTSLVGSTALVVSRGYYGTSAIVAHSKDDYINNTVVEVSNTNKGTLPSFNVLNFKKDYDVNSNTSAFQLLHINADTREDLSQDVFPISNTFDRVRLTYRYGKNDIPYDLEQLTILLVARDLINATLAKNLPNGVDGFSPEAINSIDMEIKRLMRKYRMLLSGGL